MQSDAADALDRQIIHALCLAPRASFSRIGGLLGVSDQTISRRYRRMQTLLGLLVTARLDSQALGYVDWYVRLSCSPHDAVTVAGALARHRQTSWVRITSGGTEVVGLLVVREADDRGALPLSQLASSERVTAVSALLLLHRFPGGTNHWPMVTRALSPDQIEALRPAEIATGQEPLAPDSQDQELLDALQHDGRASYAELASATRWPEPKVHRRIDQLQRAGILYFDTDLDARALGLASGAMIWMSVEPSTLAAAGQTLAGREEVAFAAATSGPSNLLIGVTCRDSHALYDFITTQIAALPGVQRIETSPVARTLKRSGPSFLPRASA